MKNITVFESDQFTWTRGHGVSEMSDLGIGNRSPSVFAIKSTRTGNVKEFGIDVADMEANEGYDGECVTYISDDGLRVTLLND